MFTYSAYNLRLRSELLLPELMPTDAGADVEVRFGPVDMPSGTMMAGSGYHVNGNEISFYQEDVGGFMVRGGREIIVDPSVNVEERILRLFILGPSLGALMHQRGRLVLHASSVVIGGSAVAFLGEEGHGKSTIAAGFVSRGYGLLADDLTPVEFRHGAAMVSPGFPQLKLHPDSAWAMGHAPRDLPRIHPRQEKRSVRAAGQFLNGMFPLRRIYVLDRETSSTAEELALSTAVTELARHSYSSRLRMSGDEQELHHQQCAALAEQVSVRRLRVEQSLAALDDVISAIEFDCSDLQTSRR